MADETLFPNPLPRVGASLAVIAAARALLRRNVVSVYESNGARMDGFIGVVREDYDMLRAAVTALDVAKAVPAEEGA